MESDKPDLNSILENARAQLEMYRRASQEELNEPAKEILLSRSKDQEMEDASGPLFERGKDSSAGVECARATSGKSVGSRNRASDSSKDSKSSRTDSEVDVEGEESSNKNFDSSTMTLGDQQSFQNQAELTSQTTYTNIHDLTGPVKDDVIVVTGPAKDTSEADGVSDQNALNVQGSDSTASPDAGNPETNADHEKTEEPQHNQMAGTVTFIQGWKSDPCRDTLEETVVTETCPSERRQEEVVDKGDAAWAAGAGTREGSPVRANTKLIEEVVRRLSQLEIEGKQSPWHTQDLTGKETVDDQDGKESTLSVSDESNSVKAVAKRDSGLNSSVSDNPPVSPGAKLDDIVDSKQMEFVERFDQNEADKCDANIRKASDKSILEDEGFVDSKDLVDSTKVIFISDQEDEQSCKPFETEDDNSCLQDTSGPSLDHHSDLEAKPSLTDVHQIITKNRQNPGEAPNPENVFSSEVLRSDTYRGKDVLEKEFNQENSQNTPVELREKLNSENVQIPTKLTLLQGSANIPCEEQSGNTSNETEPNSDPCILADPKDELLLNSQRHPNTPEELTNQEYSDVSTLQESTETSNLNADGTKLPLTPNPSVVTEISTPRIVKVHSKGADLTANQDLTKSKPQGIDTALLDAFIKHMKVPSPVNRDLNDLIPVTCIPHDQVQAAEAVKVPPCSASTPGSDLETPCSNHTTPLSEANITSLDSYLCDSSTNSESQYYNQSPSTEYQNHTTVTLIPDNTKTNPVTKTPITQINNLDNRPIAPPEEQTESSTGKSMLDVLPSNPRSVFSDTESIPKALDLQHPIFKSIQLKSPVEVLNIELSVPESEVQKSLIEDLDARVQFNEVILQESVDKTDCSNSVLGAKPPAAVFDFKPLTPAKQITLQDSKANVDRLDFPSFGVRRTSGAGSMPQAFDDVATDSNISEPPPADTVAKPDLKPHPSIVDKLTTMPKVQEPPAPTTTQAPKYAALLPPPLPISSPSVDNPSPTPFISEIRVPTMDITDYIQEPPQIPDVLPPPHVGHEIRVQIPNEADVQRIDSANSPKLPPRPPPRMRQTPQPKKKNKMNFFKRLFGVKPKSTN